jgi:16S rRNA (uracil1498-N3)-methyltransferase
MHRFFVSPSDISGNVVSFPADLSRQISRVLRMSPGDEVIVLDDTGWEYTVSLSAIAPTQAEGRVTGRRAGCGEPAIRLALHQAMIRPERFEWALQKCTELGVSHFVPIVTRRTSHGPEIVSANRMERWRRIIREAAEQSGRSRLPELDHPQTLEDTLETAPRPALMAWEGETHQSLKSALEHWLDQTAVSGNVSIFVGPEGGFEPMEVELARELGAETVGMGRRILRSETAAVALATAVMYELGELGRESGTE